MGIFHLLIIRNRKDILAEHAVQEHGLYKFLNAVIKKASTNKRSSFKYHDQFWFNTIATGDLLFMAVASADVALDRCFACLEEVMNKFMEKFPKGGERKMFEPAEKRVFKEILQTVLTRFDKGGNFVTKAEEIKANLTQTVEVYSENLEKIIERDIRIDDIAGKVDRLNSSVVFDKDLKQRLLQIGKEKEEDQDRRRTKRLIAHGMTGVIVTLLLIILGIYLCGGYGLSNCF